MMADAQPANLMILARQMHQEADKWFPRFTDTGKLDYESLARMENLRRQLLSATPDTKLDRLMQFGAMRSLVAFMLGLVTSPDEQSPAILNMIQAGLYEVILGLKALQSGFEEDAGHTLTGLGLFTDKHRLN